MRLTGLGIALALVIGVAAHAQQGAPFRASVDLVPVFATVTTPAGAFAAGLTKEDFIVLDNGKPQEIVSFSDKAQSISVSMILDTSGSMTSALPRVFAAGGVFLNDLQPDDRAMVGSLVYQGPPFTADKSRLRTSLGMLPKDPGSPVFAALDRALTALRPETNRRVVVIYTDGKNQNGRGPAIKESQVLSRIETEGVMIYAIGFEGVSLTGAMKTIATRSGGRATELKTTDDLAAALRAVADELHHQYLLGFVPVVFDGRTHTIEVRVRPAGLLVRARQTYVARSDR